MRTFDVYTRQYFIQEEPDYEVRYSPWRKVGTTRAKSEAQAVNNVRYRMGASSQYKPMAVGGHWENGLEWEARERD